jgi:hypothetical protein
VVALLERNDDNGAGESRLPREGPHL